MPIKPKRPCNKTGCRNLTDKGYCDEHAHLTKQRHKYYDKYQRDQRAAAFYNSKAWELVREQALIRDHGLCQDCLDIKQITPAVPVDHIIPVKIAWHLRLTLSNLRSLCDRHHAIKTAEDKRRYGS